MNELSAPKVLLMGAPGSGKTSSLVTALQKGLSVFALFTEPNGPDVVLDRCKKLQVSDKDFYWSFVPQAGISWASFKGLATTINLRSFEDIANMKMGIEKQQTQQLMKFLQLVENFKDDRTGTDFGDVTLWDTDRMFVLDHMSGLNDLILQQTVGLKPNPSPGEWNIAMSFEALLIKKLAGDCKCWFTLIAHLDKGYTEGLGTPTITPAAIGAKLGPKLGKDFSEVIMSKKIGDKYLWSTSEMNADTKHRSLANSDTLPPSFEPLIFAFKERQKQFLSQQPKEELPEQATNLREQATDQPISRSA